MKIVRKQTATRGDRAARSQPSDSVTSGRQLDRVDQQKVNDQAGAERHLLAEKIVGRQTLSALAATRRSKVAPDASFGSSSRCRTVPDRYG